MNGADDDKCQIDSDCQPDSSSSSSGPSHLECEGEKCASVPGDGDDECTSQFNCVFDEHLECENGDCNITQGADDDQCQIQNDCRASSSSVSSGSASSASSSSSQREGFCGDLKVQEGEECDAGSLCIGGSRNNSPVFTQNDLEACEDGGGTVAPVSHDGCSDECLLELCGDKIIQPRGRDGQGDTFDDEECDNGSVCENNTSQSCRVDEDCTVEAGPCEWDSTRTGFFCVNDTTVSCRSDDDCILEFACQYDTESNPACSSQCKGEPSEDGYCGDLQVQEGEECDAGSVCIGGSRNNSPVFTQDDLEACEDAGGTVAPVSHDGCSDNCLLELCGDRIIQPRGRDGRTDTFDDEECDNGSICENNTSQSCRIDDDCTVDAGRCQFNASRNGFYCENDATVECRSDNDCLVTDACTYDTEVDVSCSVQCKQVGSSSSSSSSSSGTTHTECQNDQCVEVDGPGNDECTSNFNCTEEQHLECQGSQCVQIDGIGTDQCQTLNDCASSSSSFSGESHTECQNNQCVQVSGPGQNECTSTFNCEENRHLECVGNQCREVSGMGENRCFTNTDCTGRSSSSSSVFTQRHMECQSDACVEVQGAGTDQCSTDFNCREEKHAECQGSSCVIVTGAGSDRCSTDDNCGDN
ncbi:hypothetical protein COU76_06095, partial [Candidatus Peregrinibacteria bacterium CG10_big_fil_rev_8_21_14_0_10_49_10]